jgi:hypothetical protein
MISREAFYLNCECLVADLAPATKKLDREIVFSLEFRGFLFHVE